MTSLTRRAILGLSAGSALMLAGCGKPPADRPKPTPTPEPTLAGVQTGLDLESQLARSTAALRDRAQPLGLSANRTAVLGWLADAHAIHVTALQGRHPTDRPTTAPTPTSSNAATPASGQPGASPSNSPAPSSIVSPDKTVALRSVTDLLGRAVESHRASAVNSTGPACLLWSSLSAYARAGAAALTSDATRTAPPAINPAPGPTWDELAGEHQTLAQVHALVFGYQAVIPWLGRESADGLAVLNRRRTLRDQLVASIRDRGQEAPSAQAVYQLPVQPHDLDSAHQLLQQMESGFLPFVGAWLAGIENPELKQVALGAFEDSIGLLIRWGGPPPVWPGYPA